MSNPEVRFHWLAYTSWNDLHDILSELGRHVLKCCPGDEPGMFQVSESGILGYKVCLRGPHGLKVCHTPGREDIHVICPGELWETLPAQAYFDLINDQPKRAKRIDLKLSGIDFSPRELRDMYTHNHEKLRTKANLDPGARSAAGRKLENKCFYEGANGDTAYIGNRESDRMIRLYNSRGTNDLELEIKGERAEFMTDKFDGRDASDTAELILGSIRDYIDFIEPGEDTNRSRAPLQEWWRLIVENIAKVKVAVPIEAATMDKIYSWAEHQVASSLSLLVDAVGGSVDILVNLAIAGRFKRKARHEQILKEAGGHGGWAQAHRFVTLPPVSQTGGTPAAALPPAGGRQLAAAI